MEVVFEDQNEKKKKEREKDHRYPENMQVQYYSREIQHQLLDQKLRSSFKNCSN